MEIRYIVKCNFCPRLHVGGTHMTREFAQRAVEEDGWRVVADGKDSCPSCYDAAQQRPTEQEGGKG
jgi:hypothetical protein